MELWCAVLIFLLAFAGIIWTVISVIRRRKRYGMLVTLVLLVSLAIACLLYLGFGYLLLASL